MSEARIFPAIVAFVAPFSAQDGWVIVEMRNPSPVCDDDLHFASGAGPTLVAALDNLRNWVDFYNSYDHCNDPLPEPDVLIDVTDATPLHAPAGRFAPRADRD